jgi:hypothetical protein
VPPGIEDREGPMQKRSMRRADTQVVRIGQYPRMGQ